MRHETAFNIELTLFLISIAAIMFGSGFCVGLWFAGCHP